MKKHATTLPRLNAINRQQLVLRTLDVEKLIDEDHLTMEPWTAQWTAARWRDFLGVGQTESQLTTIRQATHTGRPLGTPEFVEALEEKMRRRLSPQKGGRPANSAVEQRQGALDFE